jgi:hypothetical protein
MSDRPMKVVIDCSNNTEQYIPMTDEEIIEHEKLVAQIAESNAKREAEEQARAIAKASAEAKLAALGLTPEEIAAL